MNEERRIHLPSRRRHNQVMFLLANISFSSHELYVHGTVTGELKVSVCVCIVVLQVRVWFFFFAK